MHARSFTHLPFFFSLCIAGSIAVVGCGDDSESRDQGAKPGADDAGEVNDPDAGTAPEQGPLYAMMVQVYDTEDRTVYVYLSKTLDVPSQIDLKQAREFPGVANFAPVGGRLLISSGIEPSITSYEIGEDLTWREVESISFANYPFEDNANFYHQYILNDQTAYLPWDVTKRLVWNPTVMRIEEMLDDSEVPLMDGKLQARVGGNRNAIRFDGPVQQAFFYTNEDWTEDGPTSYIAIYDEKTHKEKDVIEVGCPGLSMASQDEEGYTYYGTWGFSVKSVYGVGPKPCIARLKPDLTLDDAWTTDLRDLTDGRYHNNFRYIGKGKAIANVFHHELVEGANWDGPFDQEIEDKASESGPHWKLWLFDLDKQTAKPIDGIDVDVASGAQFAVLDGRTFIFAPYDDWGRSKIYELAADGKARVHADTVGDIFKWVKVR